jgi:uncharacterized protein YodC (DUF2158 family)
MSEFQPGMVVQLKSGGPRMTVRRIGSGNVGGENDIDCEWFSGGKVITKSFKPEVLKVLEGQE